MSLEPAEFGGISRSVHLPRKPLISAGSDAVHDRMEKVRRVLLTAKRAVLCFSGGVDSSSILAWLVREQGWEVITFTANVGQRESDSLRMAEQKSRQIGAIAHESVDLQRELLD